MDERPLGWYRDPDDARVHRYWNGQSWLRAPSVASCSTPASAATSQAVAVQVEEAPEPE